MIWNCQIGFVENNDIYDNHLIATKDEEINDDKVFYYVENEDELEKFTIPANCDEWYLIKYEKYEI